MLSTGAKLFGGGAILGAILGALLYARNRNKETERIELSPKGIRFFKGHKVVWVVGWNSIQSMTLKKVHGEGSTSELLILRLKDGKPRSILFFETDYGDMPKRDQFFAELKAAGHVPVPEKRPRFEWFVA